MMTLLLGTVTVSALLLIVILTNRGYQKYRLKVELLEKEFAGIYSQVYSKKVLERNISAYQTQDRLIEYAQEAFENSYTLPFPIPDYPSRQDSGEETFRKWIIQYLNPSLLGTGLEYGLFVLIPPENLLELIRSSSITVLQKGNQAFTDAWEDLSETLNKGISHIRFDGISIEEKEQMIQNFFESVFDEYVSPKVDIFDVIIDVIQKPGDTNFLLKHIYPLGNVIIHTLDPIFHFEDAKKRIADMLGKKVEELGDELDEIFDTSIDLNLDVHFPFFTLIFSTGKEISLLNKGVKSLEDSLKAIGLKVTLVGGFTQLGTLVGSAFGPVGTIIGGFLGSVTGKLIANEQIEADFREALEKYSKEAQNFDQVFQTEVHNRITKIIEYNKSLKKDFCNEIQPLTPVLNEFEKAQKHDFKVLLDQYRVDYAFLKKKVRNLRYNIFYLIPAYNRLIDMLGDVLEGAEGKVVKCYQNPFCEEDFLSLPILKKGTFEKALKIDLAVTSSRNQVLSDIISLWLWSVYNKHQYYVSRMIQKGEEEMKGIDQKLADLRKTLDIAKEEVRVQAAKIGKNSPI